MDLAIAIIGAVAAVAAAGAAVGSLLAAGRANETAASLAAIERDRRHDEMTPEFEITCTAETPPDSAELYIVLAAARLERALGVSVTILDEAGQDHWARGLPEGVTQEEARAFVWGGWEFNTAASAEVVSTRESRARPYDRVSGHNWDLLALVPTRPGSWMGSISAGEWRKRWEGKPLRLLVACWSEGYEPWFIQRDVRIVYPDRPLQGGVIG